MLVSKLNCLKSVGLWTVSLYLYSASRWLQYDWGWWAVLDCEELMGSRLGHSWVSTASSCLVIIRCSCSCTYWKPTYSHVYSLSSEQYWYFDTWQLFYSHILTFILRVTETVFQMSARLCCLCQSYIMRHCKDVIKNSIFYIHHSEVEECWGGTEQNIMACMERSHDVKIIVGGGGRALASTLQDRILYHNVSCAKWQL